MRRMVSLVLLAVGLVAVAACTGSSEDGSSTTVEQSNDRRSIELVVVRPSESEQWTLEALTDSGETFVVSTPDEGDPTEPDVSPDGSKVVYIASGDEYDGPLWMTDLTDDEAEPQRIPADGSWVCPRWFPDMDRIVAMNTSSSRLVIIDVASGEETPVELPAGADESSCADPSPDGSRLAVAVRSEESDYSGETWSVELDGSEAELLGRIPDSCITNFPAWAPSGDAVAVDSVCEPQEHNGIWLLSGNGDAPRKLIGENDLGLALGDGLQYWAPSWIEDDAVVFHRVPGGAIGPTQIWSVNLSGEAAAIVESEALFPSAPTRL